MLYSHNITGERIFIERTKLGLSQDELAKKVTAALTSNISDESGKNISRQKIGRWEIGEPVKKLDELQALAKVFDCEIGYLLGEYPCKTKENTDICKETGLSETVVNLLKYAHKTESFSFLIDFLNEIIPSLNDSYIMTNYEHLKFARKSTNLNKEQRSKLESIDINELKLLCKGIGLDVLSNDAAKSLYATNITNHIKDVLINEKSVSFGAIMTEMMQNRKIRKYTIKDIDKVEKYLKDKKKEDC